MQQQNWWNTRKDHAILQEALIALDNFRTFLNTQTRARLKLMQIHETLKFDGSLIDQEYLRRVKNMTDMRNAALTSTLLIAHINKIVESLDPAISEEDFEKLISGMV